MGVFEQGDGDPEALAHAEGVVPHRVVGPLGQPDPLEHRRHRGRPDPLDAAEQAQVAAAGHGREQAGRLHHGSDPPDDLRKGGLGIDAEHPAVACGGTGEGQQAADGGGLPGAVGAQEAEDASVGNRQVEPVEGDDRRPPEPLVLLAQPGELDHRHADGVPLRGRPR